MPNQVFNVNEPLWVQDRNAWNAFLEEIKPNKKKENNEGKRGEELFHLILSGIKEVYDVEATIAGGAVRDLAAGVLTPKDVDVFIPMSWNTFKRRADELGWLVPPHVVKPNDYQKKPNNEGCSFSTFARALTQVQKVSVDLVFMDKPLTKENVETFPVFAQRGIWTLNEGLKLSPEAQEDIRNKQFTIDPKITDINRLDKIVSKIGEWKKRPHYKDWKIVRPETKPWWETVEDIPF